MRRHLMALSQTTLKKITRIQKLVQNRNINDLIQPWVSDIYMEDISLELHISYSSMPEKIDPVYSKVMSLIYNVPEMDKKTLLFLKQRDNNKKLIDVLSQKQLYQKDLKRSEVLAIKSLSEIIGIERRLLTREDVHGFMASTTKTIMCSVYAASEGINDITTVLEKHPLELFENEEVRKAYRSLRGIAGGSAMNKSADEFLADWEETIQDVVVKRRLTADERREEMRIAMQIRAMWKKRKAELNDKSDIVWPSPTPAISPDAEIRDYENGQMDKLRIENAILRSGIAHLEGQTTTLQKNLGSARQNMRQAKRNLLAEQIRITSEKNAWEKELANEKQKTTNERLRANRAEDEAAALAEQISDLERSLHIHKKSNHSKTKDAQIKIKELEKQLAETKSALRGQKLTYLQLNKTIAELRAQVSDLTHSLKERKKELKKYHSVQKKPEVKKMQLITPEEHKQSYEEEVANRHLKNEAEKAKRASEERAAETFVLPPELKLYYQRYHVTVAKVGGYLESVNEKYNRYLFFKYWYKPLNEIADEQIPGATPENRLNWITKQVDRLADAGSMKNVDTSPAEAEKHKNKAVGDIIMHYHGKIKENNWKKVLLPLAIIAAIGTIGYGIAKAFDKDDKQEKATNKPIPVAVINETEKTNSKPVENVSATQKASTTQIINNITFNFYGLSGTNPANLTPTTATEKVEEQAVTLYQLPKRNAKFIFSDDLSFNVVGNARLTNRRAAILVRNTIAKTMLKLLQNGMSVDRAAHDTVISNTLSIRGPRITLYDITGSVITQFSVDNATRFTHFTNGITANLAENLQGLSTEQAALFLDTFGGTLSYPQKQLEQALASASPEKVASIKTKWMTGIQSAIKDDPNANNAQTALSVLKTIREDNPSAIYLPLMYQKTQQNGVKVKISTQKKTLPAPQIIHER